MSHGRMLKHYQKTRITSAGKIDLVIICYEKAIQCLHQAKVHWQENQIEQKAGKVRMAIDIITELQHSLDFESGGHIARNLDALYAYVVQSIINGDIKRDLTVFDDALRIMTKLKTAWEEINTEGQSEATRAMNGSPDPKDIHRAQIAA
ncbi:MAG: flagellar export chaperone FliS [Pseudomonadota bacterium]